MDKENYAEENEDEYDAVERPEIIDEDEEETKEAEKDENKVKKVKDVTSDDTAEPGKRKRMTVKKTSATKAGSSKN